MDVLVLVALGSIVLQAQLAVTQETTTTLPLTYAAVVLDGTGQVCPSEEIQENARNQIDADIHTLLYESVVPLIQPDAEGHPCGRGSWARVAYLNMTNPTQRCPSAWQEIRSGGIRVCTRSTSGCNSVIYTTSGQYDRVCGRIVGYQYRRPDAFYYYTRNPSRTIDDVYVDGVSVTHGQPRQHIWTFAAAAAEAHDATWICPCSNPTNPETILVPPFVGNNYFCESARIMNDAQSIVYADDPLWDGNGCGPSSNCCSFNSPPWFSVQLPAPTTDNIEIRLCDGSSADNSPLEIIEVYVS